MTQSPPSSAAEWKAHWPLIVATTAGFSLQSVSTYATGLFMEPLNEEFGWSRAEISLGLTIPAFAMVVMSPLIGAMIDKWGSRKLAIPGCILTAGAIAAFGLANGSIAQWLGLWVIFAVVSLAVKPIVWTAAVSGTFTAGRGTALAVTLSGVAVAQIAIPPLSFWLIDSFGWRVGYAALGLGWGAMVLVPVVFFLFDAHDRNRASLANADASEKKIIAPLEGMAIGDAARSIVLWRIAAASFFTMLLGIGVIVHQVPILVEIGIDRGYAALLASLAGLAGIAGKMVTGMLMDRQYGSNVGAVTLAVSAIGFMILLGPFQHPLLIILAMIIIGYSVGAKLQISAYLTSRYGGLRNFGKIFGVISSLVAAGSGLGPVLAGAIHDQYGTYAPLLIIGIGGSVLSGALIAGLGAYPRWDVEPPEAVSAEPV